MGYIDNVHNTVFQEPKQKGNHPKNPKISAPRKRKLPMCNRPADCVSKVKQIMPEKNFAICLAKLAAENGNQPESTGKQADMSAHKKTALINEKGGFLGKKIKWAGLDSNQRRLTPTGLQPVPFSHSGTDPN